MPIHADIPEKFYWLTGQNTAGFRPITQENNPFKLSNTGLPTPNHRNDTLQELILESIRFHNFPLKPSRFSSILLFKTETGAKKHRESNPNTHEFRIEEVAHNYRIKTFHVGSNSLSKTQILYQNYLHN